MAIITFTEIDLTIWGLIEQPKQTVLGYGTAEPLSPGESLGKGGQNAARQPGLSQGKRARNSPASPEGTAGTGPGAGETRQGWPCGLREISAPHHMFLSVSGGIEEIINFFFRQSLEQKKSSYYGSWAEQRTQGLFLENVALWQSAGLRHNEEFCGVWLLAMIVSIFKCLLKRDCLLMLTKIFSSFGKSDPVKRQTSFRGIVHESCEYVQGVQCQDLYQCANSTVITVSRLLQHQDPQQSNENLTRNPLFGYFFNNCCGFVHEIEKWCIMRHKALYLLRIIEKMAELMCFQILGTILKVEGSLNS
ncbi:hypothetical protein EK904_008415 [Melospiza melodia maxima]|nr:hypothetical protein EK904_008415 [Melospiza melodia maxima]